MKYELILAALKANRVNHHMSQEDAGKIIGVSRSTYAAYENGYIAIPVILLLDLLHYYQLDLDVVKKINKHKLFTT